VIVPTRGSSAEIRGVSVPLVVHSSARPIKSSSSWWSPIHPPLSPFVTN
jgi:hypothetical protein